MNSLVNSDSLSLYSTKEVGPIIVALAFVIAVGGLTAAAIIICGWGNIKSASFNWSYRSATIVCR